MKVSRVLIKEKKGREVRKLLAKNGKVTEAIIRSVQVMKCLDTFFLSVTLFYQVPAQRSESFNGAKVLIVSGKTATTRLQRYCG